jgi:5-methylcytosine-specific restriction protein A
MRREFSKATREAALKRADGKCEGCGLPLRRGRFAYDHIKATGWLEGDNSLENCQILCTGPNSCHEKKTSEEAGQRAKGNRIIAKEAGITVPRQKIANRGFPQCEPQRTATRPLKKPLPERRTP